MDRDELCSSSTPDGDWHRIHVGPGWSLLVALDHALSSHLSVVGILSRATAGAPLAKKIPALVEGDLNRPQARDLLVGWSRSGVGPLQRVLIFNELTDPANDLDLIHETSFQGADLSPAVVQAVEHGTFPRTGRLRSRRWR
jgi:hypothetical protein